VSIGGKAPTNQPKAAFLWLVKLDWPYVCLLVNISPRLPLLASDGLKKYSSCQREHGAQARCKRGLLSLVYSSELILLLCFLSFFLSLSLSSTF
jgi:hypothetical protein